MKPGDKINPPNMDRYSFEETGRRFKKQVIIPTIQYLVT